MLASPVQLEPVDFFSGEEDDNRSGSDSDRDSDRDSDNEAEQEENSPFDAGASEAESQNPWVFSPQSPGDVNRQLFEPRAPQQPTRWGRTQNQVAAQKLNQGGAQWSPWDDQSGVIKSTFNY